MPFPFEKLLVYQKSVDLADEICSTTEQFSRGYGFLVDQLNRAALSISANIAEGNGHLSRIALATGSQGPWANSQRLILPEDFR